MSKILDKFITSAPFLAFLYLFIRLYSRTFRFRIENEAAWKVYHRMGGTVLLCAWHQHFFGAIRHFQSYRNYKPGLMISKSKDGHIIAEVARRSGWEPIRGSSSRGGLEAMLKMIEKLKKARLAGHIVDGPRGPAGEIKAGVIRISHAADAAIVPFYIQADKAWYFNSWDHFMLPKPFSKVILRFDEMIKFPATTDTKRFESQRRQLQETMLKGAGNLFASS
jgi:lysophospholipid acyltransferase (LPLAT)-like uncharacterized protein